MITTSIADQFAALAASIPEAEALLAPGREPLRFAALPERLRLVRDALAACGAGRGDRVVSLLPRGAEAAVCYLGAAACATYVPLNPEFTEAELTAYLGRLRPRVMIVPEGGAASARRSAEAQGIAVLDLIPEPHGPAGSFRLVRAPGASPAQRDVQWNEAEDVALVLLTSGSTAAYKLVPLKVRHLLAYAEAAGEHYGLGPGDRCLHTMPMFHGHGLLSSLIVPLANGSAVICGGEFDVASFFALLQSHKPTWYSAAASIHHAILARVGAYREIVRAAQLRFIRSGSGRLDPKVMQGLEEAFGAPMLERYGMSETTGTLTANPLPPGIRKPGTVGKRMYNEVAIMGEDGSLLGPNRDGEVVARGPGVFDGYLDDPAANAAGFVDGWFRTGDLGRFDDDGYLTLVGRIKDVINRGGEKIGTAEVEAALASHPAVEEACVFGIPHPSLGQEVAAAITVVSGRPVTDEALKAHVRERITRFKVPRRIFFLPSLPKGATNKVRRDQVAELCRALMAEQESAAPSPRGGPSSAVEEAIAQAWCRVLGCRSVARDDDFFMAGGDSLKAYELMAILRRRFAVTLGLRDVFGAASTVAGMARLVESARQRTTAPDPGAAGLVWIKAEGDRPPLFAVPGSGGNPVGYVHLGRLLAPRQPLIGIESRGIDGAMPPLTTLEAIATDNIARVRTVQPRGPYYLAGACWGGRVAYEMARQLEAQGEAIGLLVMLDPSAPFFNAAGVPRGSAAARHTGAHGTVGSLLRERAAMHVKRFFELRGAERRAFVREKAAVLRGIVAQRDLFRGDRSELNQRAVHAANRRAGAAYVPGPFSGPTIVCFTRGRKVTGPRNYRLDWLQLLPQAGDPIIVSGNDSGDLLNLPHVYELADGMNRWLEHAHGARREARATVSGGSGTSAAPGTDADAAARPCAPPQTVSGACPRR